TARRVHLHGQGAPPAAEARRRDREREQGAAAGARPPDVAPAGRAEGDEARLRAHRPAGGRASGKDAQMSLQQRRLLQLFAVLAAWAIVVVARLAYIQLVRHADYVANAKGQQETTLQLAHVSAAI